MTKRLLFLLPHAWLLFVGIFSHVAMAMRWTPGESLWPLVLVSSVTTILFWRYLVSRGS